MAKSFEEMLGGERAALRGVMLGPGATDVEWAVVVMGALGDAAEYAHSDAERVPCGLLRLVALITLWLDAIDARK